MFKTVIIEDDSFAQQMLSELLVMHPEFVLTGVFNSIKASVSSLSAIKRIIHQLILMQEFQQSPASHAN